MRIYWYWPHPHARASPLALAMMQPGDELVVQALPSLRGVSFKSIDAYEVVRDLPDPTVRRSGLRHHLRPIELSVRRSRARRRLLSRGFDVALIETLVYFADWFDLRVLSERAPPLVSIVNDVRPHRHAFPRIIEDKLLEQLYRPECSGHLLVFSPTLEDELVSDFAVDPARISVVPLWLDASDRRISDQEKPDRPTVLFFGTLKSYKGIDVLLSALRLIDPNAPFDVVIAGEGDERRYESIRDAAKSIPFLRVLFGYISPTVKAELYSRASLIVLPYTEFHSFSGVLADAYAYRVPVLVSDVGALGFTVREDGTGWVCRPGDSRLLAESISSAMHEIQAGNSRIAQLNQAATRHDYSQVGPRLRQVLADAAANATGS